MRLYQCLTLLLTLVLPLLTAGQANRTLDYARIKVRCLRVKLVKDKDMKKRCCIAKPGKAILELLLAHQANRGDVQWTLNDSGAPGTLVQMSER